MNIKEYAESFGLHNGQSKRMNCPECGHRNTFSVSNDNGQLLWNCFHADCDVRGRTDRRITRDNVHSILSKRTQPTEQSVPFEKPKSWSRQIPEIGRIYTETVNTSGRYDDIYFDVIKSRLVYAIHDKNGNLVDGAGRSMIGQRPKWYRYGNYRGGFRIGTSDIAFVVEDIPSAISISDWVTGYALLGTSLRDEHMQDLSEFSRVVVALDKDATDKALTMMRTISSFTRASMLMLEKDLKSLGDSERERTIRSAIAGM